MTAVATERGVVVQDDRAVVDEAVVPRPGNRWHERRAGQADPGPLVHPVRLEREPVGLAEPRMPADRRGERLSVGVDGQPARDPVAAHGDRLPGGAGERPAERHVERAVQRGRVGADLVDGPFRVEHRAVDGVAGAVRRRRGSTPAGARRRRNRTVRRGAALPTGPSGTNPTRSRRRPGRRRATARDPRRSGRSARRAQARS